MESILDVDFLDLISVMAAIKEIDNINGGCFRLRSIVFTYI